MLRTFGQLVVSYLPIPLTIFCEIHYHSAVLALAKQRLKLSWAAILVFGVSTFLSALLDC